MASTVVEDWNGPAVDLAVVDDIFPINGGQILHLNGGANSFAFFDGVAVKQLNLDGNPSIDHVWHVEGNSSFFLAQFEDAVWRVSPQSDSTLSKEKLVDVSPDVIDVQATWTEDQGLVVVTFEDLNPKIEEGAPIVFPPPERDLTLRLFRSTVGWIDVCHVRKESEELRISANGTRCVWRSMLNFVPEEAERGEIWGCDISGEKSEPFQLTQDAGRVGVAILTPDGSSVILTANYSLSRPITTHLDLWRIPFSSPPTHSTEKVRLVERQGGQAHISSFALCRGNSNILIVNYTVGLDLATEIVDLSSPSPSSPRLLDPPSASAHVTQTPAGDFIYSTESVDEYPMLWDPKQKLRLPFADIPDGFNDLETRKLEWTAGDGTKIQGTFCSSARFTTPNSPLLIHAHGGPAVDFPALRSVAARASRYPYRHLIRAGYNILMPHFRGTLGFGDRFSAANIGHQGDVNGDLGDIMAGLTHAHSLGLVSSLDRNKIGIFGGSYGGYLTMRSVSTFPDRFGAAVAMYGFVHGRWMSLETGDFTWEEEYSSAPTQVWPLSAEATASDVFEYLHKIKTPTLFLHGEADPICPKSQSLVAYRILKTKSVETGLVLYPGERHGFTKAANRKDRDFRTVNWFQKYLPSH